MTKQEIIADIKWRIKDYKEQFDFALKEQNKYEEEKKDLEASIFVLRRNVDNGDNSQAEQLKKLKQRLDGVNNHGGVDDDISRCHEQAYRCLVAVDTLERLLESIKENENNGNDKARKD